MALSAGMGKSTVPLPSCFSEVQSQPVGLLAFFPGSIQQALPCSPPGKATLGRALAQLHCEQEQPRVPLATTMGPARHLVGW